MTCEVVPRPLGRDDSEPVADPPAARPPVAVSFRTAPGTRWWDPDTRRAIVRGIAGALEEAEQAIDTEEAARREGDATQERLTAEGHRVADALTVTYSEQLSPGTSVAFDDGPLEEHGSWLHGESPPPGPPSG